MSTGAPGTSVTSAMTASIATLPTSGTRHAPDDRAGPVGEPPRPAVAVADREGGDPARAGGAERRPVADAPAGGQVGDADRPGDQRHDRAQPGRGTVAGVIRVEFVGDEAVDGQPGPDAVVGRDAAGHQARHSPRHGGAGDRCRPPSGRGPPPRTVRPGRPCSAASSMAWKWVHSPVRAMPGAPARGACGGDQLGLGEPAPPEPGLDLELDAQRPRRVDGCGGRARCSVTPAASPTATAIPRRAASAAQAAGTG